jgi:hypothetical protein
VGSAFRRTITVRLKPDTTKRRTAAGVLTHLGAEVGVQHGFVFGTTIGRAIEMAREANLSLARLSVAANENRDVRSGTSLLTSRFARDWA